MAGEALSPRSGRCERARQWASLHVDGELSELEVALLEKHLDACAACRSFATRLTAATEIVRTTPKEQPEIVYAPRERTVLRLPVRRRVAIVAIAAAAALGSFVGSSLQRPAPAPKPASIPQVSFLTDANQLRQLPRQTRQPTEPTPGRVPGVPPEGVI